MKIIAPLVLLALVIAVSGCTQPPGGGPAMGDNVLTDNTTPDTGQSPGGVTDGKTYTVTIKDFAFSPSNITIKAGDTVTWTNQDSAPHIVASNPHPTHTDLPGLVSGSLAQGQLYSFTFTSAGTFGYHCHNHPSMKGFVIVE